ncbi:hypothetical protein C8R47DRAFT_1268221 [Mycena vitilis]|nr:hypothetical protein C8R47DRAFT_1268221 [Mycena vitilis]
MPHSQHDELYRRSSVASDSGKSPIRAHKRTENSPPARPVPKFYSDFDHPPSLAPGALYQQPYPSPEMPHLPCDWWHTDTNIRIVNGTGNLWSGDRIPFAPDHGHCTTGISLKQARHGIGMFHGGMALHRFIHPLLFNIPHPMLSIRWPGYYSVQETFDEQSGLCPLHIERPLYFNENVTSAQLAQQVADYFFEFFESYGQNCNHGDPRAILLGPGGVAFDRLRLVKLWTSNHGVSWTAEIAIVDDYVQHF